MIPPDAAEVARVRELLGAEATAMSDADVLALSQQVEVLADVLIDEYLAIVARGSSESGR